MSTQHQHASLRRASDASLRDEQNRRDFKQNRVILDQARSIQRLQAEVSGLRAGLSGVQAGVTRVQADVSGLRTDTEENLTRVQKEQEENFSRIQKEQKEQDEKIARVEGMVTRSSSSSSSSKKSRKKPEDLDKALQDKGLLKDYDPKCCKCRVWGKVGGTGSQCSFKATVNGCCKKHDDMDSPDGKYGFYNEKRPESDAVGKPHQWRMPADAYLKAHLKAYLKASVDI